MFKAVVVDHSPKIDMLGHQSQMHRLAIDDKFHMPALLELYCVFGHGPGCLGPSQLHNNDSLFKADAQASLYEVAEDMLDASIGSLEIPTRLDQPGIVHVVCVSRVGPGDVQHCEIMHTAEASRCIMPTGWEQGHILGGVLAAVRPGVPGHSG